jgi:EAL domain-containing protein (putative c-di-GMP-specific phosphodiesterase class I)
MAFLPIVNITDGSVFADKALVRGTDGRGAGDILGMICRRNRYAFDQACRVTAIELASDPGIAGSGRRLSINFLPNAICEPKACIRPTLGGALQSGFSLKRIILEFTVSEKLETAHLLNILHS